MPLQMYLLGLVNHFHMSQATPDKYQHVKGKMWYDNTKNWRILTHLGWLVHIYSSVKKAMIVSYNDLSTIHCKPLFEPAVAHH